MRFVRISSSGKSKTYLHCHHASTKSDLFFRYMHPSFFLSTFTAKQCISLHFLKTLNRNYAVTSAGSRKKVFLFFPLRFSGKATYVRPSFLFFLLCQGCVRRRWHISPLGKKPLTRLKFFFPRREKS